MQTQPTTTGRQDELAIAAVRRGDVERYRELVERHERRVFALAWSRLGDAALAEDATQEAFIRAYRHLAMLSDGAKFAGWISTIARRAAIATGLRHRRELDMRERWALEQPTATEPPGEDADECAAETLRRALTELPAMHRECLVLFHLEGKSGAEAAAALGISESALRVRLHRARAALRERLEKRLGESLEQLRPSKSITPAVMGVVLSAPTQGMGGGAAIWSLLAKVLPAKFLAGAVGLLTVVPAMAFAWWMGKIEERNYIEGDGFRPQLHRQHHRRQMWGIGLGMVVAVAIGVWMVFMRVRNHTAGIRIYFLVIGLLYLAWTFASARALKFVRSRQQITVFIFVLVVAIGALLTGLGWLSPAGFSLVWALSMFVLPFGFADRPLRMDYNLFLRATQGILEPATDWPEEKLAPSLDASRLREFAGFLCARRLAMIYSQCAANIPLPLPGTNAAGVAVTQSSAEGLILPMIPVNANWRGGLKAVRQPGSFLTLSPDGTISAHLGAKDEQELKSLPATSTQTRSELESRVAGAVERAWQCFREGNLPAAEQALGQGAESKIFVRPTARSWATFGWIIFTLAVATMMLTMALRSLLK